MPQFIIRLGKYVETLTTTIRLLNTSKQVMLRGETVLMCTNSKTCTGILRTQRNTRCCPSRWSSTGTQTSYSPSSTCEMSIARSCVQPREIRPPQMPLLDGGKWLNNNRDCVYIPGIHCAHSIPLWMEGQPGSGRCIAFAIRTRRRSALCTSTQRNPAMEIRNSATLITVTYPPSPISISAISYDWQSYIPCVNICIVHIFSFAWQSLWSRGSVLLPHGWWGPLLHILQRHSAVCQRSLTRLTDHCW